MRFQWMVGSALVLAAVASLRGATPLGTGFTLQGQLKDSGVPLDGTADFQFTLWDAAGNGNPPTGGVQVGKIQQVNAQWVASGLFTVTVNAHEEIRIGDFNGDALWLQIAVRSPAGSSTTPRRPAKGFSFAPAGMSTAW